MADLLNIGLSGLSVSKTSLAVTGHNITNVNTPGFSRQDAVQATNTPQRDLVGQYLNLDGYTCELRQGKPAILPPREAPRPE